MGYTLAQVNSFLTAIDRQEARYLANLLTVIAAGSQGTHDSITKLMKQLAC